MQPRTAAPREHLTASQVDALLTGPSLRVSPGLEVVDESGTVLEDVSDRLVAGSVSHSNYATIHGTCKLRLLAPPLAWQSARVRPFLTLTSQGVEARFDLGVYLTSTPRRQVDAAPETFEVEGYGLLSILDTLTGTTYRVAAGTNVVAAVQAILDDHGAGTPHFIEQDDEVLASDRIYPLDEETTWLRVVNDLLASIGYRGLFEDWTGRYRSEPYRAPASQAPEWVYGTDERTTILHPERAQEADYFDAPNRWVFVRQDPGDGVAEPSTPDVYEVTNQTDGPTSIGARGRTITRVEFLDVTSSAALVSRGDAVVAADKRLDATFDVVADPNPLHWHFDVVSLDDPEFGAPVKAVVQEWDLDLSGSKTSLTLRKV